MSEVITTPPPPPPPPPSSPPPKAGFDFVKPFAFVFEDARWINKVLMGGVFQLLSFMLIGVPLLGHFGYADEGVPLQAVFHPANTVLFAVLACALLARLGYGLSARTGAADS